MNLPTAFTLARAYIALLQADLTPEAIADAVRLNDIQANPAIDHMADATDTNQVLLDAWKNLTGTELDFDPNDTENLTLLNTALSLAKKARFNPIILLALHLYDAGHRIDKKGRLLDPAKRLVAEEISTDFRYPLHHARAAVHMVHVWSLGTLPVGTPDKI